MIAVSCAKVERFVDCGARGVDDCTAPPFVDRAVDRASGCQYFGSRAPAIKRSILGSSRNSLPV
jgi:hypothetical protein